MRAPLPSALPWAALLHGPHSGAAAERAAGESEELAGHRAVGGTQRCDAGALEMTEMR